MPKILVMPHGMLDPYFQKAKSRRLKAVRNWVFWKLIEHQVLNGADAVLFTCEQEMLLARTTFTPYHPKKEINIGYGVRKPPIFNVQFQRELLLHCPALHNKPFLLFLSRIHPKKGIDLLIKAYAKIKERQKEIPTLLIAGPGLESPYGKSLIELVKDDSVLFAGMLEGPAKWGAFYCCEAFVLPSHQENFGIAVVEAMACKKAVLISDQVNICREIEKGQGGLINPDTELGIYNSLKTWISLPQKEKIRMGENAYGIYNSRYTIEKAAKNLFSVIAETSPIIKSKKNENISQHV
jgi:glycosyltransferase involved in cell wall biosynthesis